ncbi:MAG TPA: ester cyclase [Solirubrobacteraceae bacterium]|nr:ester cyclase [Solirubrobacteraceae bacterium]
MRHERYERIIEAWANAWNAGDVAALDQIMAPEYVRHDGGSEPVGLEVHKERILALREAFPDLRCVVEDIFGEENRLAIRWSSVGTHQGDYLGVAPTGRVVEVSGISLSRIHAWRIVEEWVTWDPRQMLFALGVVSLHREEA